MKKIAYFVLIILLVVAGNVSAIWWYQKQAKRQQADLNGKISVLQKQISGLQDKLTVASNQVVSAALPAQEVANREAARQKSQDELLTAAVAKTAPAVVSVVISKDVPNLTVTYQNPFGDDPFFKDFGIQVPVYQQNGTVRKQVGAGTGFFITSDGYILTNKHVVADDKADYTVLLSTGAQKQAKVIYKDLSNDIAVIKIDGNNYPAVSLGDSNSLKLGQTVIAIGNALGEYNNSVSVGIVSGLNRTIEASGAGSSERLSGVIQTDAAINPGNSGGPLLNLDGAVLGVNVATVQGSSNISFSIPINTVKSIIKMVMGK